MKVGGKMNKLKLLLVGGVIVFGVQCASSKTTPAASAVGGGTAQQISTAPALTAIKVDASRLLLETNGSPAYTSYSPQPDVFVVDLPRAARSKNLVIPAQLPEGVTSVAADETVELGNPLTRVTIHLAQPASPRTSVSETGVTVDLGISQAAAVPVAQPPVEVAAGDVSIAPFTAPPVEAGTTTDEPKKIDAPIETEIKVADLDQPSPIPPANGRKATRLTEVITHGSGSTLQVSLIGDGALDYKAFRLSSPQRIIIDVNGVRNDVRKRSLPLGDPYVKDIRISQFSAKPNVTRVVLDLDEAVVYHVQAAGAGLVVSFGDGLRPVSVAQTATEPVRPATSTVGADPIASLEPVAEAYTTPRGSSGHGAGRITRHVINASAPAPAPSKTTTKAGTTALRPAQAEDIFIEPADQRGTTTISSPTTGTTTTLTSALTSGSRTLSPGEKLYTGEPIDLSLKDADIKDVLRLFAQLTGLNIAIDPNVSGTVTVDFQGVPWDQALELILKQNGLTFELQGNVMRIGSIDRLSSEQAKARQLDEDKRLNVPLTTVSHKLSYAKAQEVSGLLKDMASPRGKIIVDPRTNQLIITEIPQYLQVMLNMIDTIDIQTPQVSIEARIVETTKTFSQKLGVIWNFNGRLDPALGTGTGLQFPNRVIATGGPFNFGGGGIPVLGLNFANVLGTFDLDLVLSAAETEGLAKIVSAPRVTAQDNQPADIESGVQIPLQTRVNFTTTVTYINATLHLTVTPQITAEDTVILDIQVQKVDPAIGLALAASTNSPLITRRASTKLMVRDGGTTVIGGIYQATENDSRERVPFIHQIPILGNLFKSKAIESRHDELLIFITPRIIRKT
jgi:type IV pilus assembly protein PilQ